MRRETVYALDTSWYRCAKCDRSYFVKLGDPDKNLLGKSMRCPNYVRCGGKIVHRKWTDKIGEIRNYRWTAAKELYQASSGLGFSNERNCSQESLRKLLHGTRIINTEMQDTGDPKKSILMSLTLENGKIVHLSSSVKGAIIYKVTEISNG
jgi:DNA-directed RNA polymerase subunit RPC12/RpoP